jgi:hypothetical protein
MKQLLTPLLLLSLILSGLTGCSSTSKIISSGLRVELTRVERDSSGAVQVTWRVHNPNVVSYVFSKSAHKLSLDGAVVGTIEDVAPLGVPQLSQADRVATLVSSGAAASQVIDQAIPRGSASYRLDSTIWVLIIDDELEKIALAGAGTVPVSTK